MRATGTLWTLVLLACLSIVIMVKQDDFKQCSQSSFCRRLRAIGAKQAESPTAFTSPYSVGAPVATSMHGSWTWPVKSSLYPHISFNLRIDVLEQGDGIARIRMDEVDSTTPFRRYNETAKWSLLGPEPSLSSDAKLREGKGEDIISYGGALSLNVQRSPLKITQYRDGTPQVVFNERSLLHMEHFRIKDVEAAATEEIQSESEQMVLQGDGMDLSWFEISDTDMFEENWKRWKDTKPKGELWSM